MPDARSERSAKAIKLAFLDLLQTLPFHEISMATLAKSAGVSRSTLYSHYSNTRDVFSELVKDFSHELTSLGARLRCGECGAASNRRPFCMALRAAGPYQPLVLAPEFLPVFLDELLSGAESDSTLSLYTSTGIDNEEARTLLVFQITGCYMAATTRSGATWSKSQSIIDTFIRGGLSAVRSSSNLANHQTS